MQSPHRRGLRSCCIIGLSIALLTAVAPVAAAQVVIDMPPPPRKPKVHAPVNPPAPAPGGGGTTIIIDDTPIPRNLQTPPRIAAPDPASTAELGVTALSRYALARGSAHYTSYPTHDPNAGRYVRSTGSAIYSPYTFIGPVIGGWGWGWTGPKHPPHHGPGHGHHGHGHHGHGHHGGWHHGLHWRHSGGGFNFNLRLRL